MLLKITRTAIFTAALALVLGGFSVQATFGQDGGGGGGGGVPVVTPPVVDGGNANQNQNTGTTANVNGQGEEVDIDIEVSEDTRNQGFVGATGDNIVNPGFVGATSVDTGSPLSEDASFGGGFNDTTPVTNSGGGGGGGGGGAAGGTGNVSNVIRKSIRAKLVPSFYSPRPSNQAVASRFQARFVRQPGALSSGNGYSVRIQNRTAVITGAVQSQLDSDRIERQLRLEPGVYGIVNQLSISQAGFGQQPISQQPISQQPISQQTFPQQIIPQQQPISMPQPVVPGVTRGF